jgi:uncharacterized protein (TIGR02246 family)
MNGSLHDRVQAVYQKLLQSWNLRDAERFASLFAEDGHAIGFDGSAMDGAAEIASTLATVFQNHRTATYVSKIREVREIAPGVALLRAVVGMVPPDDFTLNPSVNAVQSVVFIEQDDAVKIVLLQSTPAAFHGRPEVGQALTQELEQVLRSQRVKH